MRGFSARSRTVFGPAGRRWRGRPRRSSSTSTCRTRSCSCCSSSTSRGLRVLRRDGSAGCAKRSRLSRSRRCSWWPSRWRVYLTVSRRSRWRRSARSSGSTAPQPPRALPMASGERPCDGWSTSRRGRARRRQGGRIVPRDGCGPLAADVRHDRGATCTPCDVRVSRSITPSAISPSRIRSASHASASGIVAKVLSHQSRAAAWSVSR